MHIRQTSIYSDVVIIQAKFQIYYLLINIFQPEAPNIFVILGESEMSSFSIIVYSVGFIYAQKCNCMVRGGRIPVKIFATHSHSNIYT